MRSERFSTPAIPCFVVNRGKYHGVAASVDAGNARQVAGNGKGFLLPLVDEFDLTIAGGRCAVLVGQYQPALKEVGEAADVVFRQ